MAVKKKKTYGTAEQEIPKSPVEIPKIVLPPQPTPKPEVKPIMEKPGQDRNIQPFRQELANVRAGRAGVEPINLRTNMTATETQIRQNLAAQELQGQIEQGQVPGATNEQILAAQGLGTLTPEQQARDIIRGEGFVDTAIAGSAGLAGGVAGGFGGALLGAKLGAIGGTAVTPGVGTAVGAVGGFIVGGLGAVFGKISLDKRQDVKQAFATYRATSSNMAYIINSANSGKIDGITAANMWDEELANFYSAERNLKKMTEGKIGRELSGAMDEYNKVEGFGRRIPTMQALLADAILTPDPNKVLADPNTFVTE